MSLRKKPFVFGEYYHIYNRGNSKQVIFHDNEDYYHFIKLLYLSNNINNFRIRNTGNVFLSIIKKDKVVEIGAYCLMPNHFHLIITQTENGSISKYMQKLTTGFSMYYNQKYKRTGSLFEGKFKSEHAGDDKYFKYLFSYVHLNPIKLIQKDWKEEGIIDTTGAINYLKGYKYSSYLDYLGVERKENIIINRDAFPYYFLTKELFQNEIFEWLKYNKQT